MNYLPRSEGEYVIYSVEYLNKYNRWTHVSNNIYFEDSANKSNGIVVPLKWENQNIVGDPDIIRFFRENNASGRCWQTLGIFGMFDRDDALKYMAKLFSYNLDVKFRVKEISLSLSSRVISTIN